MNIPDPVETGLVVAGAVGLMKQGQDFIAAVLGHPGESLATVLGNTARRRIDNAQTVANRAGLILLDIGQPTAEVALNVAQPLLEGASLQEDPSLQEVWANMLANAADPRKINLVSPAFPGMLKELTSNEVRFLDALYDIAANTGAHTHQARGMFMFHDLLGSYQKANGLGGQERGDMTFSMELLERNRILVADTTMMPIELNDVMRRLPAAQMPAKVPIKTQHSYHITPMGRRFIAACRKPEKDASGDNVQPI